MSLKSIFVISLIFGSLFSSAESKSNISIVLEAVLKPDKIDIIINDGIEDHIIKAQQKNTWAGELFAPFGYIEINYHNTDTSTIFKQIFFKAGETIIYLERALDPKVYYLINEKRSKNIIRYEKMGGALLDSFVKKERNSQIKFIQENRYKFGADQSLIDKALRLGDTIVLKQIEFIKRFPEKYISFFTFYRYVVRANSQSPDTLSYIYNSILSQKFKKSKAAHYVEMTIQNKMAIERNLKFSNFSMSDTKGNQITLKGSEGYYTLFQIWASWCHPCIKEIPDLKSMYNTYKNDKFRIISVSIDEDTVAFKNAVQKYSMGWTQVHDKSFHVLLGSPPIPQVFLLDQQGRVIYDRDKLKDFDLILLRKLLSDIF